MPSIVGGARLQFTVSFKVGTTSKGNYIGVASYEKIVMIYHNQMQQYTISFSLTGGGATMSDVSVTLYGPFSALSYGGGSPQQVAARTTTSGSLTYMGREGEYYYLVLSISNENLFRNSGASLSLTYSSSIYQCPYSNAVSDYNNVFSSCQSDIPTKGWPCTSFDSAANKCLKCQDGWKANEGGMCVTSV